MVVSCDLMSDLMSITTQRTTQTLVNLARQFYESEIRKKKITVKKTFEKKIDLKNHSEISNSNLTIAAQQEQQQPTTVSTSYQKKPSSSCSAKQSLRK